MSEVYREPQPAWPRLSLDVVDRIAADPVTGSFGCLLVYLSGAVTAATQRLLSTALGQVLLSQTLRIIVDLEQGGRH